VDERAILETGLRSSSAFTLRRCQILLASAKGQVTTTMAHDLRCTAQTVRTALPAFHQRGLAALRQNKPTADVLQTVTWWRLEPVSRRFERVAEQANRLARRMGKRVQVEIDDKGIRLDPQRWAPFWAAFVHAVHNAIDHGIEESGERQRFQKPETATVSLRAMVENESLAIEIRDDGRGIDWDTIRVRARALGMRSDTQAELVEALFTDGVSTKDTVTDLSGRGVGLAALRAAAHTEGGQVTIASRPQRGTCLRFDFPLRGLAERDFLSDAQSSSRHSQMPS
jgi:chemotaxis protein histidine kinase CheA